MKLNDFGILLTSAINNTNPNAKKEILINSEKYRIILNEYQKKENIKKDFYINNYENIREQNRIIYDEYIINREILYNKWKETKGIADLENLIIYKFPDMQIIDEIYTKEIKKSKLKSK
jgi:hypothetical protein